MTDDAASVIVRRDGSLGHITLNRPRAINALTLEMVRLIDAALRSFADDEAVGCVLLDGAGERGLCAGGDIVVVQRALLAGDPTLGQTFWREEYALNARISHYPKPVVAVMNGIVMGGGVGLAGHASHRVATERLQYAMPEVGIGFCPDVGGTFLLSRTPGETGTHLALTAGRATGADAIALGLADHLLDSGALSQLPAQLRNGEVDRVLAALGAGHRHSDLSAARDWIDAAYRADTVEEILAALTSRSEPAAQSAAAAIAFKSPTALKVTLASLRRARELPSLEACLEQEFRVSLAFLDTPDFVEGIRAALVDKDRQPAWRPPTLEAVTPARVQAFFAPQEGDQPAAFQPEPRMVRAES